MPIRVVIVDDSAVARQTLRREISRADDIEVIGAAPNAFAARDLIVRMKPDVITLDLQMPRMDGVTFLRKLMHYMPMPAIVLSAFTAEGSLAAMEALEAGAVEVMSKPNAQDSLQDWAATLHEKIRAAAAVESAKDALAPVQPSQPVVSRIDNPASDIACIALGASTGGTTALTTVLSGLPANTPGTLVVQHMPEKFTTSFAERLNRACQMQVREATEGDRLEKGVVLVAPGGKHMSLERVGTTYKVRVKDGPLVCRHRPSVDVLFRSVARAAGKAAIGGILTGMGKDGAAGLLAMHQAGAWTLGQDEASSVVYGMPREAHNLGAVSLQASLQEFAPRIVDHLNAGVAV